MEIAMDEPREWITDPIEKYGDIRSVDERRMRRHLPPTRRYQQDDETPEIAMRREADRRFRIKRSSD
jgi:hypothetical protein